MICNFMGIPLRVSGPHAGVRSDIDIFRTNKPPLDAAELGLGDKAYFGDQDVEPPFKKPIGGDLTDEQEQYNVVHRCACRCPLRVALLCVQLAESYC